MMRQASNNAGNRLRDAITELKDSVRELIEAAPADKVGNTFDRVYPGRSTMSVRGARLALFNAVVALLAADLRAATRAKRAKV